MNYIQTGFLNIDKSISGLKPGKVYFISAVDAGTKSRRKSLISGLNFRRFVVK